MARGPRKSIEEKIGEKQQLIQALQTRIKSEKEELEELLRQKRDKDLEKLSELLKVSGMSPDIAVDILSQHLDQQDNRSA